MNHDKNLPTVEEFNAVWDVAWEDPPEDGAAENVKADYSKRVDMLSWYVESWLAWMTSGMVQASVPESG